MGFKVLIADENKTARELLKFKLDSISDNGLEFVTPSSNAEQAIGALFIHQPDIIIFDLKMFGNRELDVIDRLLEQKICKTKIIVVAAENQMSQIQRIVEIGAAAMVMKPVNSDELRKALNRVMQQLVGEQKKDQPAEHFITLKSNRAKLFINQSDIIFIESRRNICTLTLKDGAAKTVNENITSIDQRLTIKDLVRIDKSTIVNLSKIVYLDSDEYNKSCKLKLVNGEEVSKSLSKIAVDRLYKMSTKAIENAGRNVKFINFVLFLTFYVLNS